MVFIAFATISVKGMKKYLVQKFISYPSHCTGTALITIVATDKECVIIQSELLANGSDAEAEVGIWHVVLLKC